VLGEPEPETDDAVIHEPFTRRQPLIMLIPFANVEVAVVDAAKNVSAWMPPTNVEVAVVVEFKNATAGAEVAESTPAADQYVSVLGEPVPESDDEVIQLPPTRTQPETTLIPFAKVEVAVVEAAKKVSAWIPPTKVDVAVVEA
jgi:hypothetical protein